MGKTTKYRPPTLEEAKKALGEENIGKPIEVKPLACRDMQKFIAKINQIYRDTKKTCIQFD